MKHKGTQTLESKRLVLRRFKVSDAQKMYENWATDPLVTEFLTWLPHKNVEETKEIISKWVDSYDKDDYYLWLIEFEDEPIGSVMIFESFENFEVGYHIGRNWWNKGIITEALETVIKYAFEECELPRLFARYCIDNCASGKVMEKLGMQKEAHLRKQGKLHDGEYTDIIIRGILREEWLEKKHTND